MKQKQKHMRTQAQAHTQTWKDFIEVQDREGPENTAYNSIKVGALFVDTCSGNVYAIGEENVPESQKGFDGTPYSIMIGTQSHILTTNLRGIGTQADYTGPHASEEDKALYESLPKAYVR